MLNLLRYKPGSYIKVRIVLGKLFRQCVIK